MATRLTAEVDVEAVVPRHGEVDDGLSSRPRRIPRRRVAVLQPDDSCRRLPSRGRRWRVVGPPPRPRASSSAVREPATEGVAGFGWRR